MPSILIRCDASLSIGSGHVMRCRTLARELQRRGAVVTFLCRRQAGDLIGVLEQEFDVLSLPDLPLQSCEGLIGADLYRAWLGCSQTQDASDCLQVFGSSGTCNADCLIVDHYGLDASWERLMLEGLDSDHSLKLLVIDDLADRPHHADFLLDQNFFGEDGEHRYEGLLPKHCRQLLGPNYALLGQEYSQLHPLVPDRKQLHRVLVFFGGVDSDNLTCKTLEALMDPAFAHLEVDVVLGYHSPHRQAVENLVAQRRFTTLHAPLPSLAGLIARADLAIGAGGATTWERACLRLPSLVVAIAANQVPFAEALHHSKHIELLGDVKMVSTVHIRSALLARITNLHQEHATYDLTDGFGASRLALAILGPQRPIRLRRAEAGDEALLLHWSNDPQVRSKSFASAPIAPSEHHMWFRKGLVDPNRLHLIAMAEDSCPIGQIRFDRQPLSTSDESSEAIIGLSLDRCARGFGLAVVLVRLGLQAMQQAWGPGIEVLAEVKKSNQASNACFKRVGFVREQDSSFVSSSQSIYRWRLSPSVE